MVPNGAPLPMWCLWHVRWDAKGYLWHRHMNAARIGQHLEKRCVQSSQSQQPGYAKLNHVARISGARRSRAAVFTPRY